MECTVSRTVSTLYAMTVTTTTTTTNNLIHCLLFLQFSGSQLAPSCWLKSYSERIKTTLHHVSVNSFPEDKKKKGSLSGGMCEEKGQ